MCLAGCQVVGEQPLWRAKLYLGGSWEPQQEDGSPGRPKHGAPSPHSGRVKTSLLLFPCHSITHLMAVDSSWMRIDGEIDLINPSVSSCGPPVFVLIEWLPVLSQALLERWGQRWPGRREAGAPPEPTAPLLWEQPCQPDHATWLCSLVWRSEQGEVEGSEPPQLPHLCPQPEDSHPADPGQHPSPP